MMNKVLVAGLGALCGTAAFYHFQGGKGAHASWTTSYEAPYYARWNDNWDHRSPKYLVHPKHHGGGDTKDINNNKSESLEQAKAKTIRHLILIRHGQYNVQGESDHERSLTRLGKIQADYTGKRLKQLGFPYSTLIKSTMMRAQETGTIIADSLSDVPVKHCELLREGAPVPPEPPLGSWKQEMHQFFVDGARIEAAFRKYFHRADPDEQADSYTVLVCHANVIRYFVCRALQFPPEAWLRMSLNHGSITWISITPSGRVILRCLGDTGHMPPDVITSH